MIAFYIAQVFGFLSVILIIITLQKNDRKGILLYNGLANLASGIQYLFLGAWTGVISTVIAILRNVVFSKYEKVPFYILVIYLIVAIGFNLMFYDGIVSLIPMVNISIYAIALYLNNVPFMKISMTLAGVTGVIFDALNLALVSMLNQAVSVIAGVIGLMRYYKGK